MPVRQCPNGKWRIGEGECIYSTKEAAERAYRGYLATRESQSSADLPVDRQSFAGKKFNEIELKRKLEEGK